MIGNISSTSDTESNNFISFFEAIIDDFESKDKKDE